MFSSYYKIEVIRSNQEPYNSVDIARFPLWEEQRFKSPLSQLSNYKKEITRPKVPMLTLTNITENSLIDHSWTIQDRQV
jgi:hypothetical protein